MSRFDSDGNCIPCGHSRQMVTEGIVEASPAKIVRGVVKGIRYNAEKVIKGRDVAEKEYVIREKLK